MWFAHVKNLTGIHVSEPVRQPADGSARGYKQVVFVGATFTATMRRRFLFEREEATGCGYTLARNTTTIDGSSSE